MGKKYPKCCRLHSDCVVFYESDKICPLCVAQETIMELEGEYDALRGEHENATFGAPGSY